MRRLFPLVGALALFTASCATTPAPGDDGDALRVRTCPVASSFVPAAIVDGCTEQVADAVLARLTRPAADGGIEMDLAESVTSTDGVTWEVTIAPDQRFSDGSPVRAQNFVDAWSWSASCASGFAAARSFADIEGFDQVNSPESCPWSSTGGMPPAGERPSMSGLTVTGDHSFTIRLTRPIQRFDEILSGLAFAPLPDSFWVEPDRFADIPIGAGAYRVVENNSQRVVVQTWDGYAGTRPVGARTISWEVWNSITLAQNAIDEGELDVSDRVAPVSLYDAAWPDRVDGRTVPDAGPARTLVELVFADGDDTWSDPRRRQALSMTIDRPFLADRAFAGTRVPADGWIPPDGARARASDDDRGACGRTCGFDPVLAQAIWKSANDDLGSTPTSIPIAVPQDGGDWYWVEEVCDTWRQTLGVTCAHEVVERTATTRVGSGVVLVERGSDLADPASRLDDFTTGAPRNTGRWSNESYDALLMEAESTRDPEVTQQAEAVLEQAMPSIPLFWARPTPVWSARVSVDADGFPLTYGGRPDVARTVRD